jgi:hypothetical protein
MIEYTGLAKMIATLLFSTSLRTVKGYNLDFFKDPPLNSLQVLKNEILLNCADAF